MIKTLDIHLPMSQYRNFCQLKNFTYILPIRIPEASLIQLSTMVKLVGWSDTYWEENLNESLPEISEHRKAYCFYDIVYLRNCTLRYVAPYEWSTNWGPPNLSTWMSAFDCDTADEEVRILSLLRPTASLSTFNKGMYISNGF